MASGAVLGILNSGGLYDWIWDYIDDSITLLNWETENVEYIGSDTCQFVVKFPFDAEIPTISTGSTSTNPKYIYISDSGSKTQYGTAQATTFATSYDESKKELTINVTNNDWAENYSNSTHHYLFPSITFNKK